MGEEKKGRVSQVRIMRCPQTTLTVDGEHGRGTGGRSLCSVCPKRPANRVEVSETRGRRGETVLNMSQRLPHPGLGTRQRGSWGLNVYRALWIPRMSARHKEIEATEGDNLLWTARDRKAKPSRLPNTRAPKASEA